MVYVSGQDKYEIRLASIVSNVDKDIIIELYQPIVGANATILYLTLLKQKRNEEEETLYITEDLLNLMQLSPNTMHQARKALEAVGLLKSYEKRNDEEKSLIYVLYSPKTPKDFFDDVLFKGLITKYLGKKEATRLAKKYQINPEIPQGYENVSASFVDVFHLDYDDPAFLTDFGSNVIGHKSAKVRTEFSYDNFFKALGQTSFLKEDDFTEDDMHEVSRIATLYGLDEFSMAFVVSESYRPMENKHFDVDELSFKAKRQVAYSRNKTRTRAKSNVSGNSLLAEKIKIMDAKAPVTYLQMLQNNTAPADADIKIIDALSKNYNFSNGVINVIIDYVLMKNNNVLSRNYADKIAASLAREGVETAVDAMNYLSKISVSKKTKSNESPKTTSTQPTSVEEKKVEASDDELEALLKEFE